MCSGFLRPEKIHQPQPVLNQQTLDLKACMLPWDHRSALGSNDHPINTVQYNTIHRGQQQKYIEQSFKILVFSTILLVKKFDLKTEVVMFH